MLTGGWRLTGTPQWHEGHKHWTYRLEGHDIEGDDLTLIVAVEVGLDEICIITKY